MGSGFVFDDGGRVAAGYAGRAGDCVCRAVAIASGLPYAEVYAKLAAGTGAQRATRRSGKRASSARDGINTGRKWFKDYMASLGFRWVPTMGIGTGTTVHLNAAELPLGKLVVRVSGHMTAMIDGVIHDTYDPRRDDQWFNVAGPHHPNGDREPLEGETKNVNGVWRKSGGRAVYGYWQAA